MTVSVIVSRSIMTFSMRPGVLSVSTNWNAAPGTDCFQLERLDKLILLPLIDGLTTPLVGSTPVPLTVYSKPLRYDSETIDSLTIVLDSV